MTNQTSDQTFSILLVDDDKESYTLMCVLLQSIPGSRYKLNWEPNYGEGLKAVLLNKYDLYLVDHRLNKENGGKFLDVAKEQALNNLIILLDNDDDREVEIEVMQQGAVDFLIKGQFSSECLERSIRYALQLNHTQKKLKEVSHLNSQFVSKVAQEFRTPLSTILSSTRLINRQLENGQQTRNYQHIERIKSSVKKMTSMLNNFLLLERLTSSKVGAIPESININNFMVGILGEVSASLQDKQQIKHKHFGLDIVNIDPSLCKNILLHLLPEAHKHDTLANDIELVSENKNGQLIIQLMENGIDFSTGKKQKPSPVSLRENKVSNTTSTDLEITIVKHYLDLMDGTISFDPNADGGSSFEVQIPLGVI